MKRILLLSSGIPAAIITMLILASFGGDENSDYPGGSPAGYTGSPGDGSDCTHCHGGTSTFVEGWITSDIPPEGYTPGNTYNLTVTVTGSGDKGFQVSPQDPAGLQLGTLIAGPGTHLNGGTKYVNQSSKSTANPAVWNFQWTAPSPGTGEVTFYGAFTVNKPVTKTSTLAVQQLPLVPLEVNATADPEQICTGDSSHLDVIVSGGTGNYTYNWTSTPAGFTSTLKDPWVLPTETTTYTVEVTSGDQHVFDSVDVAVYCLGTDDRLADRVQLELYPNPAGNVVTLNFDAEEKADIQLTVFTLTGKLKLTQPILLQRGRTSFALDIGNLNPGVYLVRISDGKQMFSIRMIKK